MLSNCRIFQDRLPETCLRELEDAFLLRLAKRGETLFVQGTIPSQLFLVRKGCAKIVMDTSCGRRVITELLFPGDFCGVTCTFLEERYAFSAICAQDSLLAMIDKAHFFQLAASYPNLWLAVLASYQAKHRQQREMLASLVVETVRQRTIRILLFLASRFGKKIGPDLRFIMPFDRNELSELVGTTGESLIRSLSQLRKDGYFSESGEVVTLLHRHAMARELVSISGCSSPRETVGAA